MSVLQNTVHCAFTTTVLVFCGILVGCVAPERHSGLISRQIFEAKIRCVSLTNATLSDAVSYLPKAWAEAKVNDMPSIIVPKDANAKRVTITTGEMPVGRFMYLLSQLSQSRFIVGENTIELIKETENLRGDYETARVPFSISTRKLLGISEADVNANAQSILRSIGFDVEVLYFDNGHDFIVVRGESVSVMTLRGLNFLRARGGPQGVCP